MNNTPSYEQAPKGIEQTAEQAAEIHEQQRLDAVDKLTGEGLELDPDDAYDAYLDFVESIRESARAGELVTSAQPEPFTEEQILEEVPAEEVSFTVEANEAPEQNSAEAQDAGAAEQEIGMQHERQVQLMAEQTAESLATLTGRVAEYEQAGRLSVSAVTAAEDELSAMSRQLARFEDYSPDGARTMLVRMQDQIGSLARHMNISGQRIEEPAAAVNASEREIRGMRDHAERVDGNAARELLLQGVEVPSIDVHDRGAEAVQSVAEDALTALEPVNRAAAELSASLGEGGAHLNRAYGELEDIIRQSYSTGIDTDHVAHVLRQAQAALNTDTVMQRSVRLTAAVDEADAVLRAAHQQIAER